MADKTNAAPIRPVVDTPIGPNLYTLTALAVGVVVIAALYFGQEVLLPVTVAVLLSFVLSPLHIPHVVAVVFSVTVALGLIGGVAALVGSQLVDVAADLPRYQSTIEEKIDTVRGATVKRLSSFATSLRGALKEAPQQPTSTSPAEEQNNSAKEKPVPVEVHNPPPDPLTVAQGILRPVLHPLATAAIVFVVAIFILLLRRLRQRLPEAHLFMAVWPQDHSLVHDHDLQKGIGVSCATSLRQAVSLCLSIIRNTPSGNKQTGQVIALAKR
jgi:predicted PurR-regulated permease PerM